MIRLPPVATGKSLVSIAVVAAAYFAAARLGLTLAFEKTNATAVWPASGIAFAATLMLGYRIWPGIFLGAFVANLVTFLENGLGGGAASVWVSAGIAAGNTLEALVGTALLHKWSGAAAALSTVKGSFRFAAVALFMCLASAVIGPTTLCLAGLAAWNLFGTVWRTWWLGDTAGVLIVTPFLLSWWPPGQGRLSPASRWEAVCLYGALLLVAGFVFSGQSKSLAYLVLPFFLWGAFRFGGRETTTLVALAAGIAIWGTIQGRGPLQGETLNESLLLLQAFLCVIAVTATVLTAAVAERKRAEDQLGRYAQELFRSNQDLEQFAYVVSHDLKAPLRAISSLATWIADDYHDAVGPEGREHLDLLVGRTRRMNNLIEGILKYSRVSRAEAVVEPIDTLKLVQGVVEALSPPPHIAVQIRQPMPVIEYDQTHLEQLFQNLIDNAIKHLGKPEGRIAVSCREVQGAWEFCIEDNGVGIPEEHFQRIFKVFQTLKPKDEVESTGIGLALVKRIAERYGGGVRVASRLQEGSSFFFTVPKPCRSKCQPEERPHEGESADPAGGRRPRGRQDRAARV